ncbi:cytochrome c [Marinoscillum sp. MHG1-6]|uniref:c-type cytochrome n=1 Tax=Marinoscillum sp. MHG1-6 TaxID=2959627 RepID=UPI0021570057|nr:cytochrome c [Marinoscillum sp. MHG1-6]
MLKKIYQVGIVGGVVLMLASCTAGPDNTGLEYAPQMYHSTPYEPLSQIQDKEAGTWLDSNPEDEHGEFYNSNEYNAFGMTMREPVAGTIRRGGIPNHIAPDDYETAATELTSPIEFTPDVVKEGKALYDRFCDHCHGAKGMGDGSVGKVFKGVPTYNSAAIKDQPEGHIFHVITHGKGRMGAHSSQLSVEERWKIVSYVQTLQKQ